MQHPLVTFDLIKSIEYNIEVIRWLDGEPNQQYDMLVIHPLGSINCLEFKNSQDRNYSGVYLEIKNLKGHQIIVKYFAAPQIRPMLPTKKETVPQQIDLTLKAEDNNTNTVIFKTYYPYEILKHIEEMKAAEESTEIWRTSPATRNPSINIDSNIDATTIQETFDAYPLAPYLHEDEEIYWYKMETEVINKTYIKFIQLLTNMRVLQVAKLMVLCKNEDYVLSELNNNKNYYCFPMPPIGLYLYQRQD